MGCGASSEDMAVQTPVGSSSTAYRPSEPAPEMSEEEPIRPPPQRKRRASVSAEPTSSLKSVEKVVIPKTDEEKAAIKASIANSFLFAGLEDEALADIVNAMFERVVYEGDVVIQEGDIMADNFYIIESGTFTALKGDREVFAYDNKGTFGELALMYNCPRAATVRATSGGKLWCVDRVTFQGIIVVGMRERREKQEQTLRTMPLFKELSDEERAVIADCLVSETYDDGKVIIAQGDNVDATSKFYIVEAGEVVCTRGGQEVKTVPIGGFFGELALITDEARAATCQARGRTRVFAMGRDAFERLMGPVKEIFEASAEEYKKLNESLAV